MPITSHRARTRTFRKDVFQARARQLGHHTVAEQAAHVGISRQHLHRLFADPTINLYSGTLDQIAQALNLSVDTFAPLVEKQAA